MSFEFNNNIPIYIQLVEQLKINIISGKIRTGERLPSVRDLALKTQVNPNTMQRALAELEQQGLIYTERTNGKFVTTDSQLILSYKKQYADEITDNFFKAMKNIGYTENEVLDYIRRK